MGIATKETRKERSQKSTEGYQGIAAEGAEEKIEPDHVRLLSADRTQNASRTRRIVERPAPFDRETFQFGFRSRDRIGENREANKWIAL